MGRIYIQHTNWLAQGEAESLVEQVTLGAEIITKTVQQVNDLVACLMLNGQAGDVLKVVNTNDSAYLVTYERQN